MVGKLKIGLETVAFNEERMIKPFLKHLPDWIDEVTVLVSSKPWNGEPELPDNTDKIAEFCGANVIVHDWPNEESQRNAGLEYMHDCDWVIVLDPDEFFSNRDWGKLKRHMLDSHNQSAFVVRHQRVFYKNKEVFPHTDYQQLILLNPKAVRFIDKRVVNTGYGTAPVELLHFSWAKTDEEILRKIRHYGHATDFDTQKWYDEVWFANKTTNLHPTTPWTLKALIEPKLPPEIERLGLWPKV